MPYNPQVLDEFRLSLYSQHVGQEAINTLLIRVSTAILPGTATDQEMCDQLSQLFAPLMKSGFATDSSYMGCTLRRTFGPGDTPVTKFSQLDAGPGTGATPTLPTQVAGLISLYTELGGKKYQGRFYYPFISSDYQEANGSPTAVFLGTVLGDITGVLLFSQTIFNATPLPALLIDFGLHPTGGTWQTFVNARRHDLWATQKRRGDFGQLNRNPFI